MKARLTIAACWAVLLCCTVSASAQNRLDVTLEGPWILYEDHEFANGTPILVAFAPLGSSNFAHHPPAFGTGMGFPIDRNGTYCVGFNKACAPDRGVKTLSRDSYPKSAAEPLPVKSLAGWKWYQNQKTIGIYLIFPMPNSYSDDGTYKMRFGPQFMNYAQEEEHPIGVLLHYDSSANGPSTLDLFDCGTKPASVSDCKTPLNSQQNSGTLQVMMKAPSAIDENACDIHVRSAYPLMFKLIDFDPHSGVSNPNHDKGFIDIPTSIDPKTGKGTYDPECYKCDEQGLNLNNCGLIGKGMSHPMLNVRVELNKIINNLTPFKDQAGLQVQGLSSIADSLRIQGSSEQGLFPTFSQLEWLEILLSKSSAQLSIDLNFQTATQKAVSGQAKADALPGSDSSVVLKDTLSIEDQLAAYVAYVDATKDGKDCRAPVMLLQQQ